MKNGMSEDEFVDKYLKLCEESGRRVTLGIGRDTLAVGTMDTSPLALSEYLVEICYSGQKVPRWLEIKLDDELIYDRRQALIEAENIATKHTMDHKEREGE